jgi:hypothetical protein
VWDTDATAFVSLPLRALHAPDSNFHAANEPALGFQPATATHAEEASGKRMYREAADREQECDLYIPDSLPA